MRKIIPIVVGAAFAVLLAVVLVDAQPAPGFSKTSPLIGTGSSGSPLRIGPAVACSTNEILKWNGSAWACAADNGGTGDITDVTAGIGLEGGASSGNATVSLLSSCANNQVLKSASSGTSWVCANDNDSGGDITSVGATAGGGLTGGATSGAATLGLLLTCSTGQGLEWSGSAWACADDDIGSPGAGDIESVTAGNGLTGGGTVGAVTLDVACGTGLSCNANDVTLNLTGASCSAGSYVSALGSTGTGTCTAEVGDISSVVAGNGLINGATSGAATLDVACGDGLSCAADEVRMRQDCSTNQILKWTGTDWTCQSDIGGGFDTAGDGLTSTSTTVNVVCGSNLACAADSVNLATNVAVAGTLSTAGSVTLGDSSSDVHAINGLTNVQGAGTASVYFKDSTVNFAYNDNTTSTGYINFYSYQGGGTASRNTVVGDGQGASVLTMIGSTKAATFAGAVTSTGVLTFNAAGNVGNELTLSGTFAANGTSSSIGNANTDTLTVTATIANKLHYSGTAPSFSGSSCTCTIASYSTDARGRVTCTDGTAGTGECTITFSSGYTTNPPSCWVITEKATTVTSAVTIKSVSTSALTWFATSAGTHGYAYGCDGML